MRLDSTHREVEENCPCHRSVNDNEVIKMPSAHHKAHRTTFGIFESSHKNRHQLIRNLTVKLLVSPTLISVDQPFIQNVRLRHMRDRRGRQARKVDPRCHVKY
jgi:hypothetical protein